MTACRTSVAPAWVRIVPNLASLPNTDCRHYARSALGPESVRRQPFPAPAAHLPSSPHAHGNTAERRSLAVSGGGGGGGGGLSGEGIPTAPIHRHAGDGTMHAAMALPGNSQTILTRLFGPRPRRRPLRRRALPGNGRWRHSPHARRGGGEKEGAQGEAHDRKT